MDASSAYKNATASLENTFRVMPTEPWKSPLYLVTLLFQLPAALARGFLGYFAFGLMGLFIDLPCSQTFAAWVSGLALPAWSLLAFWIPGGGWWWHRYHGAHEASEIDEKRFRGVIEHLGSRAEDAAEYLRVYVYDSQMFFLFSRGRTMLVSNGLLESKFLKPALAHELSHFRSMDARLMQALDRLVFGAPFPPPDERRHWEPSDPWLKTGLLWFFRIAGGQPLLNFPPLRAAWAAYFRKREEVADAYAVELGQGMALARYLKAYDLQREQPNPRLLFNYREHIPVSQRIAALQHRESPMEKRARRTD
jgi:Zn-dependent protease with chaperone function